ncbi:MAG: lipocalin-like domain-containing protein [Gammaproteobacteria bacterium]|nr:lipocalin-like domain-containing protein [Gammaproteobacteria bacterium]
MRAPLVWLVAVAGLLAGVSLWLWQMAQQPAAVVAAPVASLLGVADNADGYTLAMRPGEIRWPRDHGPHPDYRTEWWYFIGNLADADGREFGFQLTFFRYALRPRPASRDSAWATTQAYMAHFAVTDVSRSDHRVVERFARPAQGLAGSRAEPFSVWLDDWSAISSGETFLPLRLRAIDASVGLQLELVLQPGKPAVLQGDNGLSAKGPEPGNASWYYSFTRLPASGELQMDERRYVVTGNAWFDREWSTSSLGANVVGWDWFALQLNDGRDVMLYVLRDAQGRATPVSAGTLVDSRGQVTRLGHDDFQLRPTDFWRSDTSGTRWPVSWELQLPDMEPLLLRAAVADQEQNLTVRYWEGTIDVLPLAGGVRVGRGYMELTGYDATEAASRAASQAKSAR